MAQIETLIPHIMRWEVGLKPEYLTLPPEQMYLRARGKGIVNVSGDKGGPTMCGVTLSTYRTYKRRPVTLAELRLMPYGDWLTILKTMFWDRCRADDIASDPIAWVLVDWAWTAGVKAIKAAQRALGVAADGIVGPKTLAALNAPDPRELFGRLQQARRDYYHSIAKGTQAQFLRGWLNRTEAITFDKILLE